MKFLQLMTLIFATSFLTGCMTTTAQNTYNQFDSAIVNAGDAYDVCADKLWSTAPHLKKVFLIDSKTISQSVKSDKSYIKSADKKALKKIIEGNDTCTSQLVNRLNSYPLYHVNKFGPLVAEGWELNREIRQNFLNGKITVAQAAESSLNVFKYRDVIWRQTHQNVVNTLNQSHFQEKQAQAAMWQAMGAGFNDYDQQQQSAYNQQQPVNKPVHTQCRWDGGVMNCSSYQY